MLLKTYWGGFLHNSCLPLELTLNLCSHRCAYCFANLNSPNRKVEDEDLDATLNLLQDFRNRNSYEAWLLQQGYGVVFSNKTDPFAVSNERADLSLRLIELMQLQGIPIAFQTKGGRKAMAALKMLDRQSVWYISLATLDEDIVRRVEPGAPSIEERFEFIASLKAAGQEVVVGINPVVPDWLSDPQALCDRLARLGVSGAWVQSMHLSHRQVENMKPREMEALGERVIHQAMHPDLHPEVAKCVDLTRAAVVASGMEVYSNQQREASHFFAPWKSLYPKRFPQMQDFVNYCHANKQDGDLIHWPEFRDFFVPQLPQGDRGLRDHLNASVAVGVLNGKWIPQRMTYEGLLKWIWQIKEIPFCPANTECFAIAADKIPGTESDWEVWTDEDDLPFLVFCPNGSDGSAFVQWNP